MSIKSAAFERDARRRRVAELYLAGITQREIAKELDVSVGTINADIKAIQKQWRSEASAKVDSLMLQDLKRIDTAISSIWVGVLNGNLDAIEMLGKLITTRAKIVGYEGLLREEYDEANGRLPANSQTVNIYNSNSPVQTPSGEDVDMKMIQAISELPADGLSLFVQNMMLATGANDDPPPPHIIDG